MHTHTCTQTDLGSCANLKGSENDIDHSLTGEHITPNHGCPIQWVKNAALGDGDLHRLQTALEGMEAS